MEHYLGVDYGRAKIGLSIGESETRMAFGYATIKNDKHFYQRLLEIIKKEQIDKVIIGVPSRINREEVEYDGERLGEYLQNIERIPVEYHNEMFSTKIARQNLKERGEKGLDRLDDMEAARIILDSWLTQNK